MATSMLADVVTNYMMADVIATCGRWNGYISHGHMADYIEKAEELLNKETYKKIPEDHTGRQKNKLINFWETSRQREA